MERVADKTEVVGESQRFEPLSSENVRIAFLRARSELQSAIDSHTGSYRNASVLRKRSRIIESLHRAASSGKRELELSRVLSDNDGGPHPAFETTEEAEDYAQDCQAAIGLVRPLIEVLSRSGMIIYGTESFGVTAELVEAVLTEHRARVAGTGRDNLTMMSKVVLERLDHARVASITDSVLVDDRDRHRLAAFEVEQQLVRLGFLDRTIPEGQVVALPDGFNGHTVKFYVEPIEIHGDTVKLRCAEPGKEYMSTWREKSVVDAAIAAQKVAERKLPEIVWEHAFTKGVAKVNGVAIGHVALRGRPDQVGAFEVILYNSKGLDHAATDYVTYEEPATARFLTMVEQAILLGTPSDVVAVVTGELDAQQQAAPDARLAEAEHAISTLSVASQNASEISVTSRTLAAMYPVKGSMPPAVVHQLYRLREAEVERLSQHDVIKEADLLDLDRGARAVVAGMLYGKCDEAARHALLHDEHAHVRSAAVISQSDLEEEAELRSDDARSLGM